MSQRVRRNVSPTSSSTTTTNSSGGGGSGASGANAGLSSFGRLLPMKATVPFQLKLQSQPPLQTRSPHGTRSGGSSPTRTSSNNNSSSSKGGCEATGTRTSTTSSSRSPTRAVSATGASTVVISPLTPSLSSSPPFPVVSHTNPSAAVGSRAGSALATVTTHVSTSGTSSTTGRSPQPSPANPLPHALSHSQLQLTVSSSSSHGNIHNNSNSNVITSLSAPPFSVPARSPCSSPTQQLLWLSDCSLLTTSLNAPHLSASPSSSSSSSSSSSGGYRERPQQQPPPQRASPEHGRQSPEQKSPGSPVFRDKSRPAPAVGAPSTCSSTYSSGSGSVSGVHHSCSLDTLTTPYLSGHWPRDGYHAQCAPCMRDKATQTPSAWADECSEKRRSSHKRSASWGSTDQLKEIAKLRQQLQRSKHSSRHHRDKERKSPFNGNHAAIGQSQAPIPKSVLIPIPISKPVSRFRNSVEGLNQEIERIIVRETGERDEQLLPQDVPDGHRAPPPLPQRSSSTRSIDTQTPSGGGGGGGGGGRGSNLSDSSSRSQSVSPTFLTVANNNDPGTGSPCSYEDLLTDGGRIKDLNSSSSPLPKYASSPKPNNSYMFKREPPEGCERVKVFEETQARPLHEVPHFLCPDRNKVNFIPKSGSAFCLVSILKPLLPTTERPLKGSGGMAVRSLSPSMAIEQEQRVTRGTSTTNQQPPLPRHLEEPES